MSGKTLRMRRIISQPDGRMVIFPLDHGVSCGPIAGLQDMKEVIQTGILGGADAMVLHKGMIRLILNAPSPIPGIFMHLSASTQLGPNFHHKVTIGSVEEAIRRGADGVSVHVNLGDTHEPEMLRDLGIIADECSKWQFPLLVMVYARGDRLQSPVPDSAIAHAARVAAELGADIIKMPAPRNDSVLEKLTSSLPIPIVVAGGSTIADSCQFLERIQNFLEAGASGVATGRNIFQRQNPQEILKAICSIVHNGYSAKEAWKEFCTTA